MTIIDVITSVPFSTQLGDPSLFGWLTVAAYLTAALLCASCAYLAAELFTDSHVRLHALIWTGLAILLLLLGINKQLDVQSWFTSVIKAIAWEQGWYAYGQRAQIYFLAGFGLAGIVTLGAIAWLVRAHWRRYGLLLLGFLFILRFIFVRIGTIYGVPLPELSRLTGGLRINWLLELVGATVIGLSALYNLRFRHRLTAVTSN